MAGSSSGVSPGMSNKRRLRKPHSGPCRMTLDCTSIPEMARETGQSEAETERSVRELVARGWMRPAWEPGSAGEGHYLLIEAPDDGDAICVKLDAPDDGSVARLATPLLEAKMLAVLEDGDMPLSALWLARAMAVSADDLGQCTSDELEDYLGAPRGSCAAEV